MPFVVLFSVLLSCSIAGAVELSTIQALKTKIKSEDFQPTLKVPPNYTAAINEERGGLLTVIQTAFKEDKIAMPKVDGVKFIPLDPFTDPGTVERRKGRFPNWWHDDCVGSRAKTMKELYVGFCAFEFLVGTEKELEPSLERKTFADHKYRKRMLVVVSYNDKEEQVVEVPHVYVSSEKVHYPVSGNFRFLVMNTEKLITIGPVEIPAN